MARIKDIKQNNPEFMIDIIAILSEGDPTKSNKYLPFMVDATKEWINYIKEEMKTKTFKVMFENIENFEDLSSRNLLDNKDIYTYKSNEEIAEAVKFGMDKVTRSEVKKKETITIFEDDKWVVLQPLTSRSSNMYGKGTKWCVSSEREDFKRHFITYTESGVLLFVIDKTVSDEESREQLLSKVAFHIDREDDEKLTAWDTADNQIGTKMMKVFAQLPSEAMTKVNDALYDGKTNQELAKERKVRD